MSELLEFYDNLFEQFWLSGMRKVDKKKARKIFTKLAKAQKCPVDWTKLLCADVSRRIAGGQFGFSSMHPSTYLNGERWEDEAPPVQSQVMPMGGAMITHGGERSTRDISTLEMLTDGSWANE